MFHDKPPPGPPCGCGGGSGWHGRRSQPAGRPLLLKLPLGSHIYLSIYLSIYRILMNSRNALARGSVLENEPEGSKGNADAS
jgi:hypothetical protein